MLEARLNKESVIQAYTGNAKVYDIWARLTETSARRIAVDFADLKGNEDLLEVAVGTGLTFEALVAGNRRGRNVGIDLTPAMLAKAKSRMQRSGMPNYELMIGDAEHLEFNDNTFDLLVNNYMFDLLPVEKFHEVLLEFKRVLKPEGRMVLTNMAQGQKSRHRFYEKLYQVNPKWMGGCRGVSLSDGIEKAGFKVEDYRYIAQAGFPSEVIKARLFS